MVEQILVQFSIDKDKLSEHAISRADAWHAFEELRKQAADVPETSLDEINAEISAARDERRQRIFSAPHLKSGIPDGFGFS